MALFSSAPNSYLGVDFHNNSLKIVELQNQEGKPKLITYGYVDLGFERQRINDNKNDQQKIAKILKQVCQQAKTTTTSVVSALPAYLVFGSILTLASMPKKQLVSTINKEAQKVIPLPLEKMVLDWKILKGRQSTDFRKTQDNNGSEELGEVKSRKALKIKAEKQAKTIRVLLTAAPKDAVRNYINIFKFAKLNLSTLDTEQFALTRSLVGNDHSALMIVDIGFNITNVIIVIEGVPFMNRSIQVGGQMITNSLANTMNVPIEQAEQIKYDLSINRSQDLKESVPPAIATALTPIVDEINYSLKIYRQQASKPIEKIILTGGSSLLLNLPEYLSQKLNLKVFRGDPWARVLYPPELKPVLDEIGARYAVAVGLAMRYIQ